MHHVTRLHILSHFEHCEHVGITQTKSHSPDGIGSLSAVACSTAQHVTTQHAKSTFDQVAQYYCLKKRKVERDMQNNCSALCSTAAGDGGIDTHYIWLQGLTPGTCHFV